MGGLLMARDQLYYIHWQRSNAFELFSCGLALCAMAKLRPSAESIRTTRIIKTNAGNNDLGRGAAKPHANRVSDRTNLRETDAAGR